MFLILLQWLLSITQALGEIPDVTLAYDNMCNVQRLRVAQVPLPLTKPFDTLWIKVKKIIDVFHYPNHTRPECKQLYSPSQLKDQNPNFNTQAGEQTFAWVGRFKNIICAMNKTHHMFYLHRMVLRRNAYTSKCYNYCRKPVLPKSKKKLK